MGSRQDRQRSRTFGRRFVVALAACAVVPLTLGQLPASGVQQAPPRAQQVAVSTAAMASGPASATDASKVPHYFGPSPNWANSPYTLPTAKISIAGGSGTGAEAVAQVDPVTGGIKSIDVTAPGHDYDPDNTTVTIEGGSTTHPHRPRPRSRRAGLWWAQARRGRQWLHRLRRDADGWRRQRSDRGRLWWCRRGQGHRRRQGLHHADGGLRPPGRPRRTRATGHVPMKANGDAVDGMDADGTVTKVVVDQPGSG